MTYSTAEPARSVAVVGGGLAGITAALACADAGRRVTLVESRARLGGLTHSFERNGLWIDNGQHVFLRCCEAYLRLLDRLGATDRVHLQPRLDVPVRSGRHGGSARLRRTGLPAPLQLGGSLARYRWLSPAARLGVVRAALALGRVDRDAAATDAQSFGAWLGSHGQGARAVEAVWDLIGIATLNARAADASLALAATVFQLGLLEETDAADIGWSLVPLQQLHGDAAESALARAGVDVRRRTRVTGIDRTGTGWAVRTVGRAPEPAEGIADPDDLADVDDVVLAVPPHAAQDLLPAGATRLEEGWADRLGSSPIVNVHLVFDRPVLDAPFVAAVDSSLQWVFDRTEQAGMDPADGQYVALSLSAADDVINLPVAQLRAWVLPQLDRLLPATGTAELKEFFVTREPHATFRPAPGCRRDRPPSTTAIPGLHLAGAWTDTGWPATMEGAVRSGESAAASVLRHAGRTGLRGTGATSRLEGVPA